MTFGELEQALLTALAERVRRGAISERRLARQTGYTQPHIHNVLRGSRGFSRDLADAILRELHLSVESLLGEGEDDRTRQESPQRMEVIVRRGLVGPGHTFPEGPGEMGRLLFPADYVARFDRPVAMRLAREADSMAPILEPGDLAMIDQASRGRLRPQFEDIHLLCLGGRGVPCRCQRFGSSLVLAADNSHTSMQVPARVSLERRNILDIVRGRVVWTCRELDFDGG